MVASAERGKVLVVLIAVCLLGTVILNGAFIVLVSGVEKLPAAAVRLVVTAALCVALYRRRNWARITLAILYGLGVAVGGVGMVSIGSNVGLLLAGPCLVWLACVATLIASRSVRHYIHQTQDDPTADFR